MPISWPVRPIGDDYKTPDRAPRTSSSHLEHGSPGSQLCQHHLLGATPRVFLRGAALSGHLVIGKANTGTTVAPPISRGFNAFSSTWAFVSLIIRKGYVSADPCQRPAGPMRLMISSKAVANVSGVPLPSDIIARLHGAHHVASNQK